MLIEEAYQIKRMILQMSLIVVINKVESVLLRAMKSAKVATSDSCSRTTISTISLPLMYWINLNHLPLRMAVIKSLIWERILNLRVGIRILMILMRINMVEVMMFLEGKMAMMMECISNNSSILFQGHKLIVTNSLRIIISTNNSSQWKLLT